MNMQIKKDLKGKLIMDFNYHDAQIMQIDKNNNNIKFLLNDGYESQINELNFINCEIINQYDLENRIIYQLEDLVKFDSKWYMSFLVWTDDNLLEKVEIEADNIISKKYEFNQNIEDIASTFEENLN